MEWYYINHNKYTFLHPDPVSASGSYPGPRDLMLRPSDNADFHVHEAIVALRYKAFQPPIEDTPRGRVPIIQVKESKDILYRLILLCYHPPTGGFPADILEHIHLVYRAAHGYEMLHICEAIRAILHSEISVDPLRVYAIAIACNLGLSQITRAAAIESLQGPDRVATYDVLPAEFSLISASSLIALGRFRRECARATGLAVDKHRFMTASEPEVPAAVDTLCWWSTRDHGPGCGGSVVGHGRDSVWRPAPWFEKHMARVHAMVMQAPTGDNAAKALLNYDNSGPQYGCARCCVEAPKRLRSLADRLKIEVDAQVQLTADKWEF